MNIKTTLALLVLAGGCVALFWKGPDLAPKLGLTPAQPAEDAGTASGAVLDKLASASITRIEVRTGSGEPVELKAPEAGRPLELPGNWPVRGPEVAELVATLTNLKSRFQPVGVAEGDLKPFGLDPAQKPVVVTVETAGEKHTLEFGRPDLKAGENPFTRPTFLRVDGKPELVRLGPDVLPVLERPVDFYRKRQLFPDFVRLKLADSAPASGSTAQVEASLTSILDRVAEVNADGPAGPYTLRRTGPTPTPKPLPDRPASDAFVTAGQLADAWRLDYPVRDRVNPPKLKAILAAVPDLWAERFLTPPASAEAIAGVLPDWLTGVEPGRSDDWFLEIAGLTGRGADKPLELTVRGDGGSARRLLIGKVSRTSTRLEPSPPPQIPGQPPQPPRTVIEEFRYAKLADNPLVFEVRGERLKDIFFSNPSDPFSPQVRALDELRDPNVVRFEADQVTRVEVERPGRPPLVLKKTKGDPKAASAAGRKDRWDVTSPFESLAETTQVTELLRPFENMQARKGDIVDHNPLQAAVGAAGAGSLVAFDLDPTHATRVQITTDAKEMTVLVGRHDAAKKKLLVRVAGWDRLNVVEDNALSPLERPAQAYRSLKLFDPGEDRVASVTVIGRKGERFELQEVPGLTAGWRLTAPVQADADAGKAGQLARDLADLQVSEYVREPTEQEVRAAGLAAGSVAARVGELSGKFYGLSADAIQVAIRFAGPKSMPEQTLTIGKAREGKSEYYARTGDAGRGVFTISKSVVEELEKGSLGLLPPQLWQGSPADVRSVEIQHGGSEPFTLEQQNGSWKLAAPLQAPIDAGLIQPLASALASVRAERYVAHAATDPAAYGLNPPALRVRFRMTEKKPPLAGEEPKEEVKERTLLIGAPAPPAADTPKTNPLKKDDNDKKDQERPGRFARLEGNDHPSVFVIPDGLFREADKSLLDLLNRKLLTVDAQAVTRLQSAGPAGSVTLVRDGANWKPDGAAFTVDRPTVDAVLRLAGNLTAARFADYGPKVDWAKYGLGPDAKPETLTVSVGNETHKVELGRPVDPAQPEGERYARVDGGQGVAVLSSAAARELNKGRLDFVDRSLLKFDTIDLQAVRRSAPGQPELELKQGATGGWEITRPAAQRGDTETLEELASRLAALRAERIAAVDVKDLKPFGLDSPAAVLKLELTGKDDKPLEKVLKLGKPVADGKPDGERFAQVEGSNAVAVLPAALSRRLLGEPIKFRDRTLASFVNADRIVAEYDLPTGPRTVTFTKGAGGWKMTAPVEADAEDEALRELHDSLARLRADELVADRPGDLKAYGLDRPRARWRLYNGDREVLGLLVGGREKVGDKKDREGFRAYAKLEKGDTVALLDMALTGRLAAEYRKRALWEPLDVAQATEIRVQTADGTGSFTLTKGPLGWMDPARPGERLSTEAVNDFLDGMAGLKAEHWVVDRGADQKLFGLEPPQKSVTVSTQTGTKRTVLLGRLDESKRVYAKLDDRAHTDVFLLSDRDTARVNRDRAALSLAPREEPKKEEPRKAETKKEEMKKEEPKKPVAPSKDEPKGGKKEPAKEEPKKEPARTRQPKDTDSEELKVQPRPAKKKD